jgi:hypothetical protein
MLTGQKYGEGADHASPIESTAQNSPQTADTTAEPTPEAANLILEQLAEPQPEVTDEPQLVTVKLNDFLSRQVRDSRNGEGLRAAIENVFTTFFISDRYKKIEDPNRALAIHALEHSLQILFREAIGQETGQPVPDRIPIETVDLVENPFQPQAYEVYMRNPENTIDVEELQKWVLHLQDMSTMQCKALNVYKRLEDVKDTLHDELSSAIGLKSKIIEKQDHQIASLQQLLNERDRIIAELMQSTNQVVVDTRKGKVIIAKPKDTPYITLHIGLTTELFVLENALKHFRDDRLEQAMLALVTGDPNEAYYEHRDYETAQELLTEISQDLARVASENRDSASFSQHPGTYAMMQKESQALESKLRQDFTEKYSLPYDEEANEVETAEPAGNEIVG